MVNVSVDTEKSFENYFDDVLKVFWEWHSKLAREDFLIVELVFHPGHQEVDVLAGTDLKWCFHIVAISPEIFIFRSG